MVSVAVMAILIAVLMPVLGSAYESARRVRCKSNLHQIGLALQMYSDDNGGSLPPSAHDGTTGNGNRGGAPVRRPQDTIFVRSAPGSRSASFSGWDGLGLLADPLGVRYLDNPEVLYCPSHHGDFGFDEFRSVWSLSEGQIADNYQYRIPGPNDSLMMIDPATTLVADSMRSKLDYNHVVGNNVLKADFSVLWFADAEGELYSSLAQDGNAYRARDSVDAAWIVLDVQSARRTRSGGPSPNGNEPRRRETMAGGRPF